MTITNGYCTLAQIKARLEISDFQDDSILESVVQGVSRSIDAMTGRRFFSTTADETRYYTAEFSDVLYVDDLLSITTLKTDDDGDRTYEDTWAATDYDLLPENAAAQSKPYTLLAVSPDGDYSFPVGVRKGVKLTGTWGWPAVPSKIKRACVLRAAWLYARKGAPLGVAGSSDMGILRVGRWDSDYERLIAEFRDPGVA